MHVNGKRALRIAAMASAFKIPIHPHSSMTGVNQAASIHFLAAIENGGYFEADISKANRFRDELGSAPWAIEPDGTVLPHVYIGRVSDGMPNLWVFVNSSEDLAARAEGSMGGAALEYHLAIHEPLRQGDVFTQLSGIRAIASKTQTMAHVLINERTGRCAASAGGGCILTTGVATVPLATIAQAKPWSTAVGSIV
jgi:hypothetical protein